MTPEQMEKAKAALADHRFRELQKRIALHHYRQDQEHARQWQLPFRMVHKREYIDNETAPNDFFPHRCGIIVDGSGKPAPIPDAERITPETALYFFTRHLAANEARLMQYKASDWTGTAITEEQAAEIRKTYLERIQDFRTHPERYDTEPHMLGTGEGYFLPPDDN